MASCNKRDGDEIVKLNVGGKSFSTYKSTLMKHPNTMLARMFSTSAQLAKEGHDGEYFIDRNPDLFSVILEYYRTNQILLPKSISLEALYAELAYFAIDFDEEDIQIVGEPSSRLVVETYSSLARGFASLPQNGHMLGKVVIGLEDVSTEEVFAKAFEWLNKTHFDHSDLNTIRHDHIDSGSCTENSGHNTPQQKFSDKTTGSDDGGDNDYDDREFCYNSRLPKSTLELYDSFSRLEQSLFNVSATLLMESLENVLEKVERVGFLLSNKYTDIAITLESLKEEDKKLVEKICSNASWTVQLFPVIHISHRYKYIWSGDSAWFLHHGLVYAFTMGDLKYLNNKGEKPVHNISGVPFIVGSEKGKRLYHSSAEPCECDDEYP